jgi:AraC-like DNA-binding protein
MVIAEDVRTSDIGETERLLTGIYRRARVVETGEPFRFEQSVRGDERVSVARYRIPSPAEFAVDIDDVLAVGTLLSGSYRAESNGRGIEPAGAFLLPPGEVRSWSRRLDVVTVYLDLRALAVAAGWPDLETVRLRIDLLTPVNATMQRQWEAVRRFAADTFDDPALLGEELIRRSVGDLLIANALACFAVETRGGWPQEASGGPATLRRALAFIDDNAGRPIGVEEIAEAARLSPRGLQDLFHRSLGTTPTRYLRTVRLDGARAELERSDPESASVAEIAARWGFTHPARFAGWYREAFGENPSRTLRR